MASRVEGPVYSTLTGKQVTVVAEAADPIEAVSDWCRAVQHLMFGPPPAPSAPDDGDALTAKAKLVG